jgi:hypothetical protein
VLVQTEQNRAIQSDDGDCPLLLRSTLEHTSLTNRQQG